LIISHAAVAEEIPVVTVRAGIAIDADAVLVEVVVTLVIAARVGLANATAFVNVVRIVQRTALGIGRYAVRQERIEVVARRADDRRRRGGILDAVIRFRIVIRSGRTRFILVRGYAVTERQIVVVTGGTGRRFLRLFDEKHILAMHFLTVRRNRAQREAVSAGVRDLAA
jgi:hypothetical protein